LPEPLASVCPEVDDAFAAIVERAMAKDPSRRYASAAEMAGVLRAWMRGRTVVASPPRSARAIEVPQPAPALPRIADFLLEKFRIDGVVGRGGMGVVYEAQPALLEQSVALKLLTRSVTAETTTRFVNEAKLAARIRSDHVPRVLDVGILPTGV